MRRLLRWAFNVAAAVSAVLFVATCVLWVRSHKTSDGLTHRFFREESRRHEYDNITVATAPGVLILKRERRGVTPPRGWNPDDAGTSSAFGDFSWKRFEPAAQTPGWHYDSDSEDPSSSYPMEVDGPPVPDHFGFIFDRQTWDNAAGSGGLFSTPDPSPETLLGRGLGRDKGYTFAIVAPMWPLALVLAAAPAILLVARVRRIANRHRVVTGRCAVCGYDLRATSGRCPECGAVPEGKGAA